MEEAPDKGWAWIVALAGFIINVINSGIYRSHGLLFVAFIKSFHVDRKRASLPFSMRMAVRNFSASVVGILGQKYETSTIIVLGGIIGTICSAACFFAPNLTWITIFWGGFYGVSTALVNVLPPVVIGQYFIKYRTTVTGLVFSGGCLGSFIFPTMLEYFLHTYGLHGTFFLLSGLIMNAIPAAMIMKMPPWWKRDNSPSSPQKTTEEKQEVEKKTVSTMDAKADFIERGIQVDNGVYDKYKDRVANQMLSRRRSYSCNSLSYQMDNLQRASIMPNISTVELNYRTITSTTEHIFDIDLDYLKQNCDLLFQMISMEIPNREISYRAILLEVEQDDLWHPDKIEVMQEIENIYCHIEKALEIDPMSNKKVRVNGLYIKKTTLRALNKNERSESVRAVKRYFKTYRERGLQLGKIRSAPNISNIYNELAKKDYVVSKLKQLCNCNEIRIISLLCHSNPKDVLKMLFQLRTLYKVYNELELNDSPESLDVCDKVESRENLVQHRESCSKIHVMGKVSEEEETSFLSLIKSALKLHTNAIYLLIICTRATFFISYTPVLTTIVDFAIDKGLNVEDGKYIIIILSVGDLLGRMCLGWITDREYATFARYMLVSMTILSVNIATMPLMYSKWTLYSATVLFGMIQGSLFIRHPILVVKYLSPQQHSIAIGCMEFSSGIVCLIIPAYIGFFRDSMGSYDPIFYINSIIVLLSGIAWLFEPRLIKNDMKSQQTNNQNSCSQKTESTLEL